MDWQFKYVNGSNSNNIFNNSSCAYSVPELRFKHIIDSEILIFLTKLSCNSCIKFTNVYILNSESCLIFTGVENNVKFVWKNIYLDHVCQEKIFHLKMKSKGKSLTWSCTQRNSFPFPFKLNVIINVLIIFLLFWNQRKFYLVNEKDMYFLCMVYTYHIFFNLKGHGILIFWVRCFRNNLTNFQGIFFQIFRKKN